MLSARISHLMKHLLIFAIAISAGSVAALPARAQTGPIEVRTFDLDYSAFPDICLRVAPVAANGMVPTDLSAGSIQVYENGEARPTSTIESEYVGSLIAVVFDASGSFARPGSTGTNRRDDAVAALFELTATKDKWLQRTVDQLLLIAPTGPESFKIAVPWTDEPVTIYNEAYGLNLVTTDTPLYKMLVEAMVRMKDVPDYERRAKFLLVFSDGVDRTSANDITDVINRANSLGVKILGVKIGPEGAGKTLQRMAEETPQETRAEWAYASYTGAASLAPLYGSIKSQGQQYRVCYRSRINQSGPHIEVGVRVGDREYKSPAMTPLIDPKPAAVRITAPADGVVYDRIAGSWDQPIESIEPREAPVDVEAVFVDNFPRRIEQVFYEVDGSVVARLSAEEGFTWDFSKLPAGTHSLRVIVRDELGLEGRSDPVRAQINIIIPPTPVPPTPTPAPTPTFCQQVKAMPRENPILLIVLVVALIAAALALYALIRLLRNPQAREAFTTTVTHAVRDATEIFRPRREAASSSRAHLVPILDDAGTRGEPIPIRWQTTLIGRDPARAQIVFADKSVSRLHARIVEEADHVFVLHDEGSSSGTYVGEAQVDVSQPRTLKPGDLLEFGRVRAIFQLAGGPDSPVTGGGPEADATEPLVRRQR